MFMFPLKVSSGNVCLAITNRDELERFIVFAQSYLTLPAVTLEAERQQAPSIALNDVQAAVPSADTIPTETTVIQEPPQLSASEEWIKKAWDAIGRPPQGATNRELYEAAHKLGYAPAAKNALGAFKAAIRISPYMERAGINGVTVLWKRTDTGDEARPLSGMNKPSTQLPTSGYRGPHDSRQQTPPMGERAIDYAVQALKNAGTPLRTAQLTQLMYDLGWRTSGKAIETMASTLRKSRYGKLVANKNGFWVLAGE